MITKRGLNIIIVLSLIAVLLSTYLAYVHYKSDTLGLCTVEDSIFSCEDVSKTKYAYFFGLEWMTNALMGIIGYSGIILLSVFALKTKSKKNKEYALGLTLLGSAFAFLYALYLTYIEFAVLLLFCPFCLLSQIIIAIILWIALKNYLKIKNIELVIE